ncbi:MAG: endonuclease/exonuclease/phosphatase family protein [Bacteroidales bacterium]|nr:endonuclease/exonuclease/phosphatase family protein [Bacteroidales bacterium]
MKRYIDKIAFWLNLLFVVALLLSYASSLISPKYIWHLAFFGLFYPLLLVVNFAFAFYWIFRKSWLSLISVSVILLGWGFLGRFAQLNLFSTKNNQFEYTSIISYNVHLFDYYKSPRESSLQDEIMKFVSDQNPEIVCLQEILTFVDTNRNTEKEIDNALDFLPYHHIGYIHKPNTYSNYGLATYSMYPIVKREFIRFRNSYNSCIYSDIAIGRDTIRVFNVHLQSIRLRKSNLDATDSLAYKIHAEHYEDVKDISGRLRTAYIKRAQQVDELKKHIERSPYPVIVCGDFNDTPVSYTYQQVRGNLKDAFRESGKGIGNTYRGQFNYLRIDYIFHSSKFRSYNYKTHKIHYSDHFPVSCSLFKN